MPTLSQWMDKGTAGMKAAGTSEGASKGWDTRGRGRSGDTRTRTRQNRPQASQWTGSGKFFTGYHHSTIDEGRPYHILEGAGVNGGQWAALEAKKSGGGRELAVYDSREEAEDHAHASQPD